MFMNILTGVMVVIAILAGVGGFLIEHKKDEKEEEKKPEINSNHDHL